MTTGIKTGGVDIDTLFMNPLQTTKGSDVYWFTNFHVDIANHFEPYTTGTKVASTGLESGGVDFADLFQNALVSIDAVDWTTIDFAITTFGQGGRDRTGIRFNTDGSTDSTNFSGAWVPNTNNWGSPEGSVTGSNFKCMYNNLTGSTPDALFTTSGNWVSISAERVIEFYPGGTGSRSCSFDLHVRKGDEVATEVECRVTLNQGYEA